MRTAYAFDPLTGDYAGEVRAHADPLPPFADLLPAAATWDAPPAVAAGQVARWNGIRWRIADMQPPEPAPLPVHDRRAEILARLAQIDKEGARAVREVTAALTFAKPAPSFAVTKLAALETEADALRAELASLPA